MRSLIFVFLFASFAYAQTSPIEPGVSQELAKWRAAHYSDVRYKLNLTLEKMSPVLKGTIEIRVKVGVGTLLSPSPQGGEKVPIILDWRKIRGHEEKSTVSNVTLNGEQAAFSRLSPRGDRSVPAPFEEIDEHLVFRDGVVLGENVIKIDFTSPILTSGSAITRYVDKEDGSEYIYSLFVPSDASTAFPVFDQPDLKARFSLTAVIPRSWAIVGNTVGVEDPYFCVPDEPGAKEPPPKQIIFAGTQPISTYVFAFAAGPFERVSEPPAVAGGLTQTSKNGESGGKPAFRPASYDVGYGETSESNTYLQPPATAGGSDIYVRRSQAAKFKPHANEVFRLNREAVKYFEQYFDYKFPFPKYDLVLIPEFPFGGMEHAGATFLRESAIIFPQEPTKNDHISRATLIFHETAHQWFGDTVTMRWFDDLWLKEGFATFMAYKAMEKIMPEMNSWKVFYERVKQGAYQTDSTKGTTPIYQEIKNLSAAKSAYGAIVYNKAPAFLRQAEFYLGEDKFQTAVRAFLKKHEFGNAGWEDLVGELANTGWKMDEWTAKNAGDAEKRKHEEINKNTIRHILNVWVTSRGAPVIRMGENGREPGIAFFQWDRIDEKKNADLWTHYFNVLFRFPNGSIFVRRQFLDFEGEEFEFSQLPRKVKSTFVFPNYQDYGYGIFLLDDKSREYVLKNIQNEKDPFLRSMMWGSLWDSVREGELDPREYVELVVKVVGSSAFRRPDAASKSSDGNAGPAKAGTPNEDESTTALLLNRVGTAMNYYLTAERVSSPTVKEGATRPINQDEPSLTAPTPRGDAPAGTPVVGLRTRVEKMLIERMQNAETLGQRITYYRALLNIAGSENARAVLKKMLTSEAQRHRESIPLKTKDKFDIVTRLLILDDPDAPRLLAELEKTETSDDAKRYAYAAKAGIATAENKAKFWNDFTNNKEISESWIEAAFVPWNSIRHSSLTLPYLQKALQELPNHKRNRKIFFVNGWLGAFIGGQRSEEALAIVNKFLSDNPNLDRDLRLKILENVDLIERAVKIRAKYRRN